jgi:SAM-dependent methyltransferase
MSHEWEARYQQQDTPWDKGAPSPPLIQWLKERTLTGRVLVPGCGSGHDVRALAAHGLDVVGLDVAPSATLLAKTYPRVANETYVNADFFDLSSDLMGGFDWVIEHTCFCAIPPRRRSDYVRAAHAALRPQGGILGIFYLNPRDDPDEDGPPFGVTEEALREHFGDGFEWVESFVPDIAYSGREGRELVAVIRKSQDA